MKYLYNVTRYGRENGRKFNHKSSDTRNSTPTIFIALTFCIPNDFLFRKSNLIHNWIITYTHPTQLSKDCCTMKPKIHEKCCCCQMWIWLLNKISDIERFKSFWLVWEFLSLSFLRGWIWNFQLQPLKVASSPTLFKKR